MIKPMARDNADVPLLQQCPCEQLAKQLPASAAVAAPEALSSAAQLDQEVVAVLEVSWHAPQSCLASQHDYPRNNQRMYALQSCLGSQHDFPHNNQRMHAPQSCLGSQHGCPHKPCINQYMLCIAPLSASASWQLLCELRFHTRMSD